jgi:hypothetical protein
MKVGIFANVIAEVAQKQSEEMTYSKVQLFLVVVYVQLVKTQLKIF